MRSTTVVLLLVSCAHGSSTTSDRSSPEALASGGAPGLSALDARSLETTTRFLASDELEGRGTGTPGGAKAEQYVADKLKALGLEPAGEGGTYFQTIPMREATRIDAESSLVVHAQGGDVTFAPDQIVLYADPRQPNVSLDAPLVFVGYGVSRPDLGYDDLTGVDLHGAIAVVMCGAPRTLGGKELDPALHAVLADIDPRTSQLRAHGASAVISVYDPVRAARMPFSLWVTKIVGPTLAWLENGQPRSEPFLPMTRIDEAGLDRILSATPKAPKAHALWEKLDRGEHVSLPLGRASLRIKSTHREVSARNVAALLRGTQPDEAVVYTAHLDHLGIGPAIDGDRIYNGAMDNAIGVAAMLEIAHAFKALPTPPRRSVLFVAVTGEEKGLLGSDYFAAHPTIPFGQIAANVNIDGVTAFFEVHDVVGLGAEHSSLSAQVDLAARAVGLVVSPDPDPAQVFFIRSDQYSFARRGVPALFPGSGNLDAAGGREKNQKIGDEWAEHHLHRPSDDWHSDYRAEWTLPEMRFEFLLGLAIANATERPHWNTGDVFANFVKTPFQ
jgi:hypothetical protein